MKKQEQKQNKIKNKKQKTDEEMNKKRKSKIVKIRTIEKKITREE